jgi:hypothetical protein
VARQSCRLPTKSGKWRAIPLARAAFVALDELSQRAWFTSPADYVFCTPAGDPLNPASLQRTDGGRAGIPTCLRKRSMCPH